MKFLRSNIKLFLLYASIIINLTVIVGWFTRSDFIITYFADEAGMKFNTALFFLLISLILVLDLLDLDYKKIKRVVLTIILILSSYTLFEYIIGDIFDIDNFIIYDNYNLINPGRMSIGTASSFMLLTVGLIFQNTEKRSTQVIGQNLFALIIAIASISFVTHILNIPGENKSMFLDTMSIGTSLFFIILGFISNFKHKQIGPFSPFFTKYSGSALLHKILPIIILLPILLSYLLIKGIAENYIKVDFGIVLQTILLVVITFIAITSISKGLNTSDKDREKLDRYIDDSNKKLESINIKLKEKNKELEQFVYIASHDLQEPLRTVSSITELLATEYETSIDETGKTYLQYITGGVTRMQDLVRDLMDYSRIGAKLELTEVNFNDICKIIEEDLLLKIKETNAEIICPNLPVITANEGAIRQLFQNLISNAIKFKRKNINPKITITTVDKGDYWQFNFTDNGIGVAPENHEKIFKIFKRLHNESEYPGTGIGLANCKKIVAFHKGNIWITSNLNEGSTFHFTIKK